MYYQLVCHGFLLDIELYCYTMKAASQSDYIFSKVEMCNLIIQFNCSQKTLSIHVVF